MTVIPDPDLMAAQPESMYAAAASYESAAHAVGSVAGAIGRASSELLAEWQGRGAAAFAARMNRLMSATPEAAQALLAIAAALRSLAARISEAQGLAPQAMTLDEQAATVIDQAHHHTLAAVRAQAVVDDISPAQTMMDRANGISRSAWQAARTAFDAITGISPSVKTATLTSAVKSEPARQPNDHRPKVSADQVRVVTQADGRRVYSFDGGLAIPVDLPGAHQFVEEVKAYMPRLLRGDTGNIEVPAGLSAKDMWFEAAYLCATTTLGEVPRELRNVFSTATSSSITFRQVAGFAMLGTTDAVGPTDLKPETAKGSDFLNNGDVPPDVVADRQIVDTNRSLGTKNDTGEPGPLGTRGAYDPTDAVTGQLHEYSCVAASCSMVAGWPQAYWRTAAGVTDDGATMSGAAAGLTKQGFPYVYRSDMSLAQLGEATSRGPVIVAGGGHALVVDSVADGQVYIRDPWPIGRGSSYSLSASDFSSWWSGKAVVPGGRG